MLFVTDVKPRGSNIYLTQQACTSWFSTGVHLILDRRTKDVWYGKCFFYYSKVKP